MIWLVSFPRSGNTFCRNILYHCYGLDSQPFFLGKDVTKVINPLIPVIKTHHHPHEIPLNEGDIVLYIIRDGRDSMVSMANQMVNLTEPGSHYNRNIARMLLNDGPAYFGGWAAHVAVWKPFASLIITFDDLIKDPIHEIEKLRGLVDLPQPNINNIPSFDSQREGLNKFPVEVDIEKKFFFHNGESGGWEKKLNKIQLLMFYQKYGKTLVEFGFERKVRGHSVVLSFVLKTLLQANLFIEEYVMKLDTKWRSILSSN